jgi:hypothetical protein
MRSIGAVLATLIAAQPALAQTETLPRKPLERVVVGYLERVRIFPGNLLVYGKIDTGARTSSLNAQDLKYVERDGKTFVRFSVTNRDNETRSFERPVIRRARIRDLGRPPQIRPVVMLGLCIGNIYRYTQVNLSNRAGFNFQLLVGRRFMAQRVLVDPVLQYTVEPTCPQPNHAGIGQGRPGSNPPPMQETAK